MLGCQDEWTGGTERRFERSRHVVGRTCIRQELAGYRPAASARGEAAVRKSPSRLLTSSRTVRPQWPLQGPHTFGCSGVQAAPSSFQQRYGPPSAEHQWPRCRPHGPCGTSLRRTHPSVPLSTRPTPADAPTPSPEPAALAPPPDHRRQPPAGCCPDPRARARGDWLTIGAPANKHARTPGPPPPRDTHDCEGPSSLETESANRRLHPTHRGRSTARPPVPSAPHPIRHASRSCRTTWRRRDRGTRGHRGRVGDTGSGRPPVPERTTSEAIATYAGEHRTLTPPAEQKCLTAAPRAS